MRCGAGLALAAALVGAGCSADTDEAAQAASVNGERITYADLHRYAAALPAGDGVSGEALDPHREELRRLNLLRELVDQRLLLQRAAGLGLAATDGEVAATVERYRLPYGSDREFEEALEADGLGRDELRLEVRRRLTAEKVLAREVAARVTVGEDEMRAYYERHTAAFTLPEQQLHLAQILVNTTAVSPVPNLRNDDATDPESARRKIRRIHQELEDGADFAQLARQFSEDLAYTANGGDMGFVPQSALEKADVRLRGALVGLAPGEFSQVVETSGEYRILRLIAVEPAGRREFDDPGVRDAIREVLFNRKEQLLRTAFYEVERNRAEIRNRLAERILAHGPGG